ncbi:MAG: VOC family protein [Acidobacteria bacterium]|nr:VOC family protein [Acidobacteriota bacterium]
MNDFSVSVGCWCWPELATTDIQAAKAFYGKLLGWNSFDVSSAGGNYTLFRVGEADCAGCYAQSEEQRQRKDPVRWTNYVKVASADEAAKKAESLGGKIVAGPFDVPGVGRMAALRDPRGVPFALWQDGAHIGLRVAGRQGAHCWTELTTRDPQGAAAFYSGLFGWTVQEQDMGGFTYRIFNQPGADMGVGGLMAMEGPEWGDMPDHFMQYFLVDDADATAGQVASLGGKVCVPVSPIPKVGRFAVLQDPQGGTFSILEPEKGM